MTTIAYSHKHKQLAVDSRCIASDVIVSDSFNKAVKKDGAVWLFSGSCCWQEQLINAKHGDTAHENVERIEAFKIAGGCVYHVCISRGVIVHDFIDHDWCIGSGADFAQAALDHGKTPREAVEYAKTRDPRTGGKVRVFSV